jgi:hypothetical protein
MSECLSLSPREEQAIEGSVHPQVCMSRHAVKVVSRSREDVLRMPGLPRELVKRLPVSRFPVREDLPTLSAPEARKLLGELRGYLIDGRVTVRRGPKARAPQHRRYLASERSGSS